VAIGSVKNDDNGIDAGHVRVYRNFQGGWIQIGDDIDGLAAYDKSGQSVSISADGNIVAIGAIGNGGPIVGYVRVFEFDQGVWNQIGQRIDGEALVDYFGFSVSLSDDGTTLAVGAILNDGNGASSGHVRVFQNMQGVWTQIGDDIDGEGSEDQSGHSVSLNSDGTILAIGANGNNAYAGHVRVYQNIQGNWSQVGDDINGESSGDLSGYSVAISDDGSIVAIGAPNNSVNGPYSGHVRVFQNTQGVWTQIGDDIEGEASEDSFGISVALNSDGSTLAVGGWSNDGNGNASGHVRVIKNIQGNWVQIGDDIDGEAAVDYSGFSVSLSSDGRSLAVGAYGNDGSGMNSGHVKVYEIGIKIQGKVYQDYNLDNELDGGEPPVNGQIIQLTKLNGNTKYRTTTIDGDYYFETRDSGTYVVSYNPPSNFIETGGVTSVTLVGLNDTLVSDVNFGVGYTDTIVDIQSDITAFTTSNTQSTFNVWTSAINVGNVTTNYATTISTDVLTSVTGFNQADSVLQPGQVLTDLITLNHATNNSTASVGVDIISNTDLGSELALSDNQDSVEVDINFTPCCPYDPNDKTVFGAYCEANYVEIGDTLEYRIRFMNTGTAPANTVILIDTLDASVLDLRTFRVIGHSHPMYWDISGPGKLTITYPDINLPDSSVSFLGSQGFFKFRIVMRDTVSNLTQSGSSAFIYFDNEAPIETNEPNIIAVDSIPVSELTATDAICGGESGLIDASISFGIGADSAYWGNGSTGLPLPYNDEGTYTVELVDEYGCRYLDSIAVSCNILTSIEENGEEFSVYPNPSNGKYYVNAKGNVRVFDVSGKEVYRTSSFNAPTEVDLSALPSGIYTIQLTNKGGVFTGKVVRE
jgi:uncharacterized repeat protein (TIGR01451 family)